MIKSIKHYGFTIVELLIAVIIIAILVAILAFSYSSMIAKSEETACLANRKTIEKAYSIYRLDSTEAKSLSLFLQNSNGIADPWIDNKIKCPTKGVYTASEDKVICSIHSLSSTPPIVPGNVIPGTNEYGGTGLVADVDWNDRFIKNPGDPGWTINAAAGMMFLYDGKYYVATSNLTNVYVHNPYPGASNSEWWLTSSGQGIVETTGTYTSWDEVVTGDKFTRGDILYYDGNYYICNLQAGAGEFTVTKGIWYSNPPSDPSSSHAWFNMGN